MGQKGGAIENMLGKKNPKNPTPQNVLLMPFRIWTFCS
jgi:hypothetical protein